MKLSIIIPVYNMENYIRDCLDSILHQYVEGAEVICVNDGSTDHSLSILEEYRDNHNFIHVYSKKNGGLSSARNYGIEKSEGEYLFFLDSDDKLAEGDCLSFMIQTMQNAELDVLYFDGKSFFENETIHREQIHYEMAYQRKKSYGVYLNGRALFLDLINNRDYYVQASLQCIRREFLNKNHLHFEDGILYEDNLFMFEGMLLAGKVMHQNKTILLRRVREGSIMQSSPGFHNFYSLYLTYEKMLGFWKRHMKILSGMKEVSFVTESIRKSAISLFDRLSTEEKGKLLKLPDIDQYMIETVFHLCLDRNPEEVTFPYHLFYYGSRIVIYGAGKIGRKFYNHAVKDGIIKLSGIVDSNASEIDKDGIPVLPVSAIEQMEFDYILIAVMNPAMAREIQSSLLDRGIPEHKLKWDSTLRFKNNIHFNYEYSKLMNRLIKSDKRRLFLFLLPEHGNLGDHAIAMAEEGFLKRYFPEYQIICVTANEYFMLQDYITCNVNPQDIIFLQGGGYIGNLWKNGVNLIEIVKRFPGNIKIMFPNSLAYRDSYEQNFASVKNDLKILYQDVNLYIFFRDIGSFQFYKQLGYGKRCYYFPDIALYLSEMFKSSSAQERNKNVLLCLRQDEEKVMMQEKKVKEFLKEHHLRYEEKDTHLNRYLPKSEEKQQVKNLLNMLYTSRLVITDRLHGLVLSAICGTPCIAFDNSTHKIRYFYEWLKAEDNIFLCEKMEELPQYIYSALAAGYSQCKSWKREFDAMAGVMKKIISGQVNDEKHSNLQYYKGN